MICIRSAPSEYKWLRRPGNQSERFVTKCKSESFGLLNLLETAMKADASPIRVWGYKQSKCRTVFKFKYVLFLNHLNTVKALSTYDRK